jgi:uncharacterized cupredoxin-like copper-binding protein
MRKASALFVAIALAVFGLAACGGGDDEATTAADTTVEETTGGGGAGGTVDISSPSDGSLAYDQTSAETTPGTVTINYDNPASISHDVTIEDESGSEVGATDLVSGGSTSTTVELTAGTYTFYCSVPGHRDGGMEGTLTVN